MLPSFCSIVQGMDLHKGLADCKQSSLNEALATVQLARERAIPQTTGVGHSFKKARHFHPKSQIETEASLGA